MNYNLTREQIQQIIDLTLAEARSATIWGEGIDLPVLWLRIDRDVLGIPTRKAFKVSYTGYIHPKNPNLDGYDTYLEPIDPADIKPGDEIYWKDS